MKHLKQRPLAATAFVIVLAGAHLSGCGSGDLSPRASRFGRMQPWGAGATAFVPSAPSLDAEWSHELRIFEVHGHPCHYLRLATVYRRLGGQWERAAGLRGPWLIVVAPAGLPQEFRWHQAEAACDSPLEPAAALSTVYRENPSPKGRGSDGPLLRAVSLYPEHGRSILSAVALS